ncbi:adenosylcobinamide-GDP ribazoletransferase [Roseovarius sp. 2305UL8-3]|uniref:adenosylcobinamide-GDP ribazoletransferase n=1 Tax=Roseovarius conchicola TaxID=3121636 RepID=UPI0035276146
MVKNDTSPAKPQDVLIALTLLSRLPLPEDQAWDRQAKAAWAYPLVGVVLGGLAALAGLLAMALGLPAPMMALITLTVLIVLSGGMHEDGLADTADGFWGGWTRERRLEIMKDSHIGSYGVIALILSLAARWACLWLLWDSGAALAVPAVLASAVVSRAAMPAVMTALPHARATGLSHQVGKVSGVTAWLGGGLAALLAVSLLGGSAIWAMIWGALVVFGLAMLARRKICGQTGDVLGASQQLAEITLLVCLSANLA